VHRPTYIPTDKQVNFMNSIILYSRIGKKYLKVPVGFVMSILSSTSNRSHAFGQLSDGSWYHRTAVNCVEPFLFWFALVILRSCLCIRH
jgi:hypothetical protein